MEYITKIIKAQRNYFLNNATKPIEFRIEQLKKLKNALKENNEKRYIEPTILIDVDFNDEVMQEEIFGPILPVIAYNDLSDAIRLVKENLRPLACYIYTEDDKTKNRILEEVSFGGGAVNDSIMHITNPKLPFGGVGESGIGSYHGEKGFQAFTHYKCILDKPTWIEFPFKYYQHTALKLNWIKKLLG